LTIPHRKI